MTNLRTDPTLLQRLKDAATQSRLSASEIRQQKISFIIGSLGDDSNITRERVEEELKKLDGEVA